REKERKGRSLPHATVHGDPAAMGGHDALANRKPEPHALFGFGGKEGAEDLPEVVRRNASARVRHHNCHFLGVKLFVHLHAVWRTGGLYGQPPAVRHRFECVEEEVEQYLLKLLRVGVELWEGGEEITAHCDLLFATLTGD